MERIYLDINYGVRKLSQDERVKSCYVYRNNKFTNKLKKIKVYYVDFGTLGELQNFCSSFDMDFVVKACPLDIDDEHFNLQLKVQKRAKWSYDLNELGVVA